MLLVLKYSPGLLLLFAALSLFGQEETIFSKPGLAIGGKRVTRAVVVGISDYQNDSIPDLRFAHRDAEVFSQFLHAPAGGSLPGGQVKVLLNRDATRAKFAAALEWLIEQTQPGDKAVIYFSGHGDVETKAGVDNGFLLTWDTPSTNYVAGAFPIEYLLHVIGTLSDQNKAGIVLITDACRSGNLAGSYYRGAEHTNASLITKKYNNEIKILSCQPSESSLEGLQWGGGRGVFSYFLVDGLMGLADRNQDDLVTLFELETYLGEQVPEQVAPHQQFPMSMGDKKAALAHVNMYTLDSLRLLRETDEPALSTASGRSLGSGLAATTDSALLRLYRKFNNQLSAGNLLEPADSSAYDLYLVLSKAPELGPVHGEMQRNLAAALQDDAQNAVNAYLAANPVELQKRYAFDPDYARLPRYLQKSAEILGEQNFYYPYIMAKLRYFEGLQLRLDADKAKGTSDQLYAKAVEKQREALKWRPTAFIYNELGVLYTRLKDDAQALGSTAKAIELAPEWGLPYVNYCVQLFYTGDYPKAIEYGEKALTKMPHYAPAYNFLGWIYADFGRWWDWKNWDRRGTELQEDYLYGAVNTGETQEQKDARFKRTRELLQQAVKIDPGFYSAWCNLGAVYIETGRNKEAEACFDKALELNPYGHRPYYYLGFIYSSQGKLEQSEQALLKALALTTDTLVDFSVECHLQLGLLYQQWLKPNKANVHFEKMYELAPGNAAAQSHYGRMLETTGKVREAEHHDLMRFIRMPQFFHFGIAGQYIRLKRYEEAIWWTKWTLAKKPDHSPANNRLAGLYTKTRQWEKAEAAYENSIKVGPIGGYLYAARYYYQRAQPEKAEAYFEKGILADTVSTAAPVVATCAGRLYRLHDEPAKAEAMLKRAIEALASRPATFRSIITGFYLGSNLVFNQNPKMSAAHWNLAWLYLENGRLKEAQDIFDAAIEADPTHAFSCFGKALTLYFSKKYKPADHWFEKAAALDSNFTFARQACSAFQKGKIDTAAVLFEKAIAAFEDDNLRYLLCRVKTRQGKYGEALDLLERDLAATASGFQWTEQGGRSLRFLENDPDLAPLRRTHRYRQLVRTYYPEKFTDLDPFQFEPEQEVYFIENIPLLAGIYKSQGAPEMAARLLQKALEIAPEKPSPAQAFYLAKVYLQLDREADAQRICPQDLETDNPLDLFAAAEISYQLRRPEKADRLFRQFIEKSGNKASVAIEVGKFYVAHGDTLQARRYLDDARQWQPKAVAPYHHLAWLAYSNGNADEALRLLETAIEQTPGDRDSRYLNILFRYFAIPPDSSRTLFYALEKGHRGFAKLWEFLESLRTKDYAAAVKNYPAVKKSFPEWWGGYLEHLYLGALVQAGDAGSSAKVLHAADPYFLNHTLLETHPLMVPLRETDARRLFIRAHFPEKIKD